MKRALLLVACLVASIVTALAQTTVRGTVVTPAGEPVVGAYVVVSGQSTLGTITDAQGAFSIANVPSSAKEVIASCIGMKTVAMAISGAVLKIVMEEDNEFLDEVVVTAQGLTRKEKSLGYSTVKIDGEKLTMSRQTDLGNSLAGKVSGARFFSTSGAEFDSGSIVIRGTNAWNSAAGSEPIYVVDGTITNKNAVNMDDVQSVNVLKGPAATALYGSQGGNGAVIITTRSAKDGESHIEFSHTTSVESFYNHAKLQKQYGGGSFGAYADSQSIAANYPNADVMSPEFLCGTYFEKTNPDGSYYYDYGSDENWGARYDKNVMMASALYYDPTSPKYQKADPWVHQLDLADLFRTGYTHTTNVAFSKANKDHSTRISFTNSDRSGITPNSHASRRYLTIKEVFKPAKWLKVNLDYKFTYRRNKNASGGGYAGDNNQLDDYLQWGQGSINLKDYKDWERIDHTWRSWNISDPDNLTATFHDNPYAVYATRNRTNAYVWNVITGDAEVSLPFNLKAGFRFMGNIRSYNAESRYSEGSINYSSYYGESQDHTRDLTFQGRLTWDKTFLQDRLGVQAAAFVEEEDYDYGTLSGNTTNGLAVDKFFNLNASNGYVAASNSVTKYKTRSVYANATVSFDDTYFVDLSIRNDWDSRLPERNNSFLYGGASFSVMVNKFIKAKWLDFWKIRGSFAQVGSTMGAYNTFYVYNAGTRYNSTVTLSEPTTQINPNIKPTISTSYEVGTEFRMFKNRFHGDINFYQRDSKNQIINVPTPSQSGFGSRQVNAGLIRNKGIEIALGGTAVKSKDFSWDVDFNIARNVNKLVRLDEENSFYLLGWNKFQDKWGLDAVVGKAVGELWTEGRWLRHNGKLVLKESTAYGGKYSPIRQSGVKEYKGSFQPKFTGGFSTGLRFKDFYLGASLDFSIGGKLVSWTNMWGQGSGTLKESAETNNNGINVREPIRNGGGVHVTGYVVTARDSEGNATAYEQVEDYLSAYDYYHDLANFDNDKWIYNRSYVKLRELSLTYNLPKKFIKNLNMGLSSASIAFVATNPWLIYSAVPNIDPSEAGSDWLEGGQSGATRTFGATIKLMF